MTNQKCPEFDIDHQILFVGYGYFKGKEAWVVKNSWGAGWGDYGYFYTEIGQNSFCIEHYAGFILPTFLEKLQPFESNKHLINIYDGLIVNGRNGFDDNGRYKQFISIGNLNWFVMGFGLFFPSLVFGMILAFIKQRKQRKTLE